MPPTEVFEIASIPFEFTNDSRIECREGVLTAMLTAEAQPFDASRHSAFKDQSGVIQPRVRIRRLTFPTAAVERTLQSPNVEHELNLDGFSGIFTARFEGTLQVADGWLVIDGMVRSLQAGHSAPLLIRKQFEPGPVDPRLHRHCDLSYALSLDPQLVRSLALLQSGLSVPTALFQLHHLEELTLRYFSDERLPDLFDQLPELARLTIMNVPVKELPPSLGALQALTELTLYDTQLERLPDSVCNLTALRRISIDSSQLSETPDGLFRLPALRSISLSGNRLASLPESVGANAILQEIWLEGNPFIRLPRSLANVPRVSIEAKYKPLYTKASYKSRNRKRIDQSKFNAAGDKERAALLAREVSKHGLLDYRADLLKLARRAVMFITTDPDDYSIAGSTRIGGAADLPRSAEYPTIDDEPVTFLAQINLADIQAYQEYLPRTGLLSFFASLVDEEEFAPAVKVLYSPDTSDLVRHDSIPAAACGNHSFQGFRTVAAPCCSLPFASDFERRLLQTNHGLAAIAKDAELKSRYENVCNSMLPEPMRNRHHKHCINTFVYAQTATAEELACEVHGGVPEEWLVLLSLASDDPPGFCFVDGGTLTFCVHKRDLAIADFSKVVASIESG